MKCQIGSIGKNHKFQREARYGADYSSCTWELGAVCHWGASVKKRQSDHHPYSNFWDVLGRINYYLIYDRSFPSYDTDTHMDANTAFLNTACTRTAGRNNFMTWFQQQLTNSSTQPTCGALSYTHSLYVYTQFCIFVYTQFTTHRLTPAELTTGKYFHLWLLIFWLCQILNYLIQQK